MLITNRVGSPSSIADGVFSILQASPYTALKRETMADNIEFPRQVELCGQCRSGLIFYLPDGDGRQTLPYCPKCGARKAGQVYLRKDLCSGA